MFLLFTLRCLANYRVQRRNLCTLWHQHQMFSHPWIDMHLQVLAAPRGFISTEFLAHSCPLCEYPCLCMTFCSKACTCSQRVCGSLCVHASLLTFFKTLTETDQQGPNKAVVAAWKRKTERQERVVVWESGKITRMLLFFTEKVTLSEKKRGQVFLLNQAERNAHIPSARLKARA